MNVANQLLTKRDYEIKNLKETMSKKERDFQLLEENKKQVKQSLSIAEKKIEEMTEENERKSELQKKEIERLTASYKYFKTKTSNQMKYVDGSKGHVEELEMELKQARSVLKEFNFHSK